MKTALIITTINKPNKNILKFSNFCKQRKLYNLPYCENKNIS